MIDDYDTVDELDCDHEFTLLQAVAFFGPFAAHRRRRDRAHPRGRAVAKVKTLLREHGLDQFRPGEFFIAFSIFLNLSRRLDAEDGIADRGRERTGPRTRIASAASSSRPISHPDSGPVTDPVLDPASDPDADEGTYRGSDLASESVSGKVSVPNSHPFSDKGSCTIADQGQILGQRKLQVQDGREYGKGTGVGSGLTSGVGLTVATAARAHNAPCDFDGGEPSDGYSNPDKTELISRMRNVDTECSRVSESPPSSPDQSIHAPLGAEHVKLVHHMLRHAESIYGLPLNMLSAPATSLSSLSDRQIILKRTGLHKDDILSADFKSDAFRPAYYVAIDRRIQAIVVCVRGTAGILDSLTDIAATLDPLKVFDEEPLHVYTDNGSSDRSTPLSSGADSGSPSDPRTREQAEKRSKLLHGKGHTGVIRSARSIYRKVRDDVYRATQTHPTFDILATGHSLGGAVAALLALIMRDDADLRARARAICLGPLPCVTLEIAEEANDTVISVVK
jgi:Lipase (class 3)